MRQTVTGFLAGILLFVPAARLYATTVTLKAVDSESITANNGNYDDNILRAGVWVTNPAIDGLIKFDLSTIPDSAAITSMALTTTYYFGVHDPQVRIYRVADNSWSRSNPYDPFPQLAEPLSPIRDDFPGTDKVPYDWTLDANAVNWSSVLAGNFLSLAMKNEQALQSYDYSYVFWYGSGGENLYDPSGQYAPTLTVSYSDSPAVPEPTTVIVWSVLAGVGITAASWRRRRKAA
jgi:hypothetical protein